MHTHPEITTPKYRSRLARVLNYIRKRKTEYVGRCDDEFKQFWRDWWNCTKLGAHLAIYECESQELYGEHWELDNETQKQRGKKIYRPPTENPSGNEMGYS